VAIAAVFVDFDCHLTNTLVWQFHCQRLRLGTILWMAVDAGHCIDPVIVVWIINVATVTSQTSKAELAVYRIGILTSRESQRDCTAVLCNTGEVSIDVTHEAIGLGITRTL
jgi:hypothetical protein